MINMILFTHILVKRIIIMKDIVCEIVGISQGSYYRWKQERPIINLLEKYCNQEDLQEYLDTGRIEKFEKNFQHNDDMEDFFLKNGLMKIEIYGTQKKIPFFISIKQVLNFEPIEAVLPVKTFLKVLTNNNVTDLDSFNFILTSQRVAEENWRLIIMDFILNKLSKKELNVMIKNKKYVTEYLNSLSHLNC